MNTNKKISHISGRGATPETLAKEVLELTSFIKALTDQRKEATGKLLAVLGSVPSEGTTSFEVGKYCVKVVTRLNRALNEERVAKIADKLPKHVLDRVFKRKLSLSVRELRWLEQNDVPSYKLVRKTFVARAGAAAVSVAVR